MQYIEGAQLGFDSLSTIYNQGYYQVYLGISDNGLVVGQSYSSGPPSGGFAYDIKTGIKTVLSYPSPNSNTIIQNTIPLGISSNGMVFGLYHWCDLDPDNHQFQSCLREYKSAFFYKDGVYTSSNISVWVNGYGIKGTGLPIWIDYKLGVNNNGDVVGSYCDQFPGIGSCHGSVLYSSGEQVQLDFPGATTTFATDINNKREIVGYYYKFTQSNESSIGAFIYKDGKMTSLCEDRNKYYLNHCPLPGGINDNGEMVSSWDIGGWSSQINWAVCSNGIWNINTNSNGSSYRLKDINNHGQIVGQLSSSNLYANVVVTLNTPTLIDPVPSLLDGPQITSKLTAANASPDQPYLADLTKGRPVNGLATDGVTQVIIRIPANAVGDQFTLNIRPNQCSDFNLKAADCIDEYGFIFDPANPPANVFST